MGEDIRAIPRPQAWARSQSTQKMHLLRGGRWDRPAERRVIKPTHQHLEAPLTPTSGLLIGTVCEVSRQPCSADAFALAS